MSNIGTHSQVWHLEQENHRLRTLADRYIWLETHAKEVLLDPKRASSEICPDMRTKWEIPVLICSGPVGGTVSFGEAIDIARGNET